MEKNGIRNYLIFNNNHNINDVAEKSIFFVAEERYTKHVIVLEWLSVVNS